MVDVWIHHRDASKWREKYLLLERVLRKPREIGSTIDQSHVHLKAQTNNASRSGISDRHVTIACCRHERVLDTTSNVVLVRFHKLVGQDATAQSSVDLPCFRQLRELDDSRVNHVECGHITVALRVRED